MAAFALGPLAAAPAQHRPPVAAGYVRLAASPGHGAFAAGPDRPTAPRGLAAGPLPAAAGIAAAALGVAAVCRASAAGRPRRRRGPPAPSAGRRVVAVGAAAGVEAAPPPSPPQDRPRSVWKAGRKTLSTKGGMDIVETLNKDMVRRCRKGVKQVATIGRRFRTKDKIEELFLSGVDVFRLDLSQEEEYRSPEEFWNSLSPIIAHIREVEETHRHPIGIVADLQGPTFKCGQIENGEVTLNLGAEFRFDLDEETPGDQTRAGLPEMMLKALTKGKHVVVDEGNLTLQVTHCGYIPEGGKPRDDGIYVDSPEARPEGGKPFVDCKVLVGGGLAEHATVTTPDTVIDIDAITEKDRRDIGHLCEERVDWVTLNFVQGPGDVQQLEKALQSCCEKAHTPPRILATDPRDDPKLERLREIVALPACKGVIVHSGFGADVYRQQDIIALAKDAAKTVVSATQMQDWDTATLAEESYVASIVFDGCDAVMLGDETAKGKNPSRYVKVQRSIIDRGEKLAALRASAQQRELLDSDGRTTEPIVATAKTLVQEMNAQAIICFTDSGNSVVQLVQQGVNVPILAVCRERETARWLSLLRGVYARIDDEMDAFAQRVQDKGGFEIRFSDAVEQACQMLRESGMSEDENDWLVVIGRSPLFTPGEHNSLQLTRVKGPRRTALRE